ncbi:unnamed protein product [Bursaphelenchus okinawaensis]|uniref:Uncharacterized protein n=1 Tax=Bursaphelenchus okinawaensis TaxID=465554 RepID=A0A811KF96_9BILA|nr:unnamed protein product [Bursaphelenchus okinawaensis]CAG9102221.1 unnamed protein product [Bursaphelenchus okinawaensis]
MNRQRTGIKPPSVGINRGSSMSNLTRPTISSSGRTTIAGRTSSVPPKAAKATDQPGIQRKLTFMSSVPKRKPVADPVHSEKPVQDENKGFKPSLPMKSNASSSNAEFRPMSSIDLDTLVRNNQNGITRMTVMSMDFRDPAQRQAFIEMKKILKQRQSMDFRNKPPTVSSVSSVEGIRSALRNHDLNRLDDRNKNVKFAEPSKDVTPTSRQFLQKVQNTPSILQTPQMPRKSVYNTPRRFASTVNERLSEGAEYEESPPEPTPKTLDFDEDENENPLPELVNLSISGPTKSTNGTNSVTCPSGGNYGANGTSSGISNITSNGVSNGISSGMSNGTHTGMKNGTTSPINGTNVSNTQSTSGVTVISTNSTTPDETTPVANSVEKTKNLLLEFSESFNSLTFAEIQLLKTKLPQGSMSSLKTAFEVIFMK